MHRLLPLLFIFLLPACTSEAQQSSDASGDMTIEKFEPRSSLVVEENIVTRAKYPFVDVHSHWFRAPTMTEGAIDTLMMEMDGMNMVALVNLSGGSGENLQGALSNMEAKHPNRIVTFANVDFDSVGAPEWTERAVAQLRTDIEAGARGLKVYKNLGLDVMDVEGNRVAVNDPRLDPIWALAGEMGVPVLIHSAEPANFWNPKDEFNEKWLELKLRPNRYRDPATNPSWEQIMSEHYDIMAKHRGTTFISAHLSWLGQDLTQLGQRLDENPNMVTEVAAVIYELGRQPRTARQFMIDYKDRLLFGKDSYNVEEFWTYFRVFETADEYFPYYRKYHAQWKMYGMNLPDDVLRAVYYENALRIIPGLDPAMFE
ncbi:MAG: amidohydrolase family protein [Bacteroidetes bacterium]|nr:amidohydrolase family protein [Bacteroidota bacterium]MDA1332594.1 amidohydrolase family protein [Bacteroidota bacterium]